MLRALKAFKRGVLLLAPRTEPTEVADAALKGGARGDGPSCPLLCPACGDRIAQNASHNTDRSPQEAHLGARTRAASKRLRARRPARMTKRLGTAWFDAAAAVF